MEPKEQRLILPWIALPPNEGEVLGTILISAPDGNIVEVGASEAAAKTVGEILQSSGLWHTFFSSLVQSVEPAVAK